MALEAEVPVEVGGMVFVYDKLRHRLRVIFKPIVDGIGSVIYSTSSGPFTGDIISPAIRMNDYATTSWVSNNVAFLGFDTIIGATTRNRFARAFSYQQFVHLRE
jgi:hypothetical protein